MSQICQADSFEEYWTSRIGYIEQEGILKIPDEQPLPTQNENCIESLISDQNLLEDTVALVVHMNPSKRRKRSDGKDQKLIDMLFNDSKPSRQKQSKKQTKCGFKSVDSSIASLEK